MTMFALFVATYGAVFVAEIVGDKLLYTTGVLAARYRSAPIMVGMGVAFMVKMGVAVLVGDAIAHLPRLLVAAVTSVSFIGVAYTLWRKPDVRPAEKLERDRERASTAALVSFAAIFLSEWGDVGQITAATMAARYRSPLFVIWLGAVSAMVTKGILAAFLGAGVRQWIRDRIAPRTVRYVGVAAIGVLGIATVVEVMMRGA
jgi:putative Ca2+/H+ antiporter (TMEM165/GDT1 family)